MRNEPATCPVSLLPDLRLAMVPDARPLTVPEAMELGLALIQSATIHSVLLKPARPRRKAAAPGARGKHATPRLSA